MRALIDCNNFFVSCERVFNPALNGKPVVVLSGNDGCVIARSNEAKELGIPMGAPVYQWREVIERGGVRCFSANHRLYNDMSRRIMTILAQEVDEILVYSVDEAFFDVSFNDDAECVKYLSDLAFKIEKYVGVPVSIGASYTRTLAKIASHIAKKEYGNSTHCYLLTQREDVHSRLAKLSVKDVWGIGRRMCATLAQYNVKTAADFATLPRKWVKDRFTITGERTWLELHGVDNEMGIAIEQDRQSISHSRTFSAPISDIKQLSEAIATFVSICAAKLREENLMAARLMVYIAGNRFIANPPQYSNSAVAKLPFPTNSTMELVRYAISLFETIYRDGCSFKKAGVVISDLVSASQLQLSLFNPIDEGKHNKLMEAVDNINNRVSRNSLFLAANGIDNAWKPKCEHKSREFTTSISEILTINCTDNIISQ